MKPRDRQGVLFVSHDATRTGAPMNLLHFLRWFKKHGNRPFSVLLGGGGELKPEFESLAETWAVSDSRWRPCALRTNLLIAFGAGGLARRAETSDLRRFASTCFPGVVYANSIASARAVEVLAPSVPVVTHVHELQTPFRQQPTSSLAWVLDNTRVFVACSLAVRENLIQENAVASSKIETVHEAIETSGILVQRCREEVFRDLQLPEDGLLVLGCGTGDWRKGPDAFVQLARVVSARHPKAYFGWVGGFLWEMLPIERDVRLAGLADRVRLIERSANAADYLAAADVFVLTSREDPFPLVCLEAAALEKPIVCFAGAGGMPEFVEDDCGFVVPYLDLQAMAHRVISLLESPEYRKRFGAAAQRKVRERHDIEGTAPRILEIIERTIAS